jgi:hypothetical protein
MHELCLFSGLKLVEYQIADLRIQMDKGKIDSELIDLKKRFKFALEFNRAVRLEIHRDVLRPPCDLNEFIHYPNIKDAFKTNEEGFFYREEHG